MIDHELELQYSKEALHAAIDRDSPDEATAKAAKVEIYLTVIPLRDFLRDEAERSARELSKGWPTNRQSRELPEDTKLPVGIGESLTALPRKLSEIGLNIRSQPESMSVEQTLRRYVIAVARRAWEEGTMRLSDALDSIIKPATAARADYIAGANRRS